MQPLIAPTTAKKASTSKGKVSTIAPTKIVPTRVGDCCSANATWLATGFVSCNYEECVDYYTRTR